MKQSTIRHIGKYYNALAETYDVHPGACDYGSEISQKLKFEKVISVLPNTFDSILDFGCGLGDLANKLKEGGVQATYLGIDCSSELIRRGRKKTPGIDLRLGSLEEIPNQKFDVVVALGVFYLLIDDTEAVYEVLAKLFDASKDVLVASTLSSRCPDKLERELYLDPIKMLYRCFEIAPYVSLFHDYHDSDFIIRLSRHKLFHI